MDCPAKVPPGKSGIDISVFFRNPQVLGQKGLYCGIPQRLQLKLHTARKNRWQKCLFICRNQDHNRIRRRLLDRLKERVLGLYRHFLGFINDIDLIITAVGPDHNRVVDLLSDIVNTDAGGFFMRQIDQIRVASRQNLLTRMAAHARFASSLFA